MFELTRRIGDAVHVPNLTVLALPMWLIFVGGCEHKQAASVTRKFAQYSSQPGEPLDLFETRPIGLPFESPPRISYVEIVDLNRDDRPDVLVCDCVANSVSWIEQTADGQFEEHILAENLVAPARVECVDFDNDGDLDLLVAVLGVLYPSNDKIGSLVALINDGRQQFERKTLLDQVARVSDVRSGDLDQDGDLDLVVTQFGYNEGMTQWLEHEGEWQFQPHPLLNLPGGIHGIVSDMNGDQLLDLVFLISQEIEKTFVFYGLGQGKFREQVVYDANNPDFGSAGIWLEDLDQDGDQDILYCNGDAFDYSPPRPWPWHGIQWLENAGNETFVHRRLMDFGGAVNAHAADFDQDGDYDIFVSSTFNDWDTPESQSLMLLVNTGNMQFVSHALANTPSHIQALDVGDIDGDGQLDLVTGGMHVSEPYDRVERVVLWRSKSNRL